jgi:hypothetical protein
MNWEMTLGLVLAFLIIPVIFVLIDGIAGLSSKGNRFRFHKVSYEDFRILVPIYGSMKYLENREYLSQYGSRVTLCTTGNESPDFMKALYAVAIEYGFETFVDEPHPGDTLRSDKRATSGTTRDRLIRNALATVKEEYVIPLDADSTTQEPFGLLVGELRLLGLDIASIRLVTSRADTLLTRLQRFEYRLAMQLRTIFPWMISGACHVAKTSVLSDIMDRHSLFFQGNDVEIGLIAHVRRYKIGHVPFEVTTNVPETAKGWMRQRLAWAGGEFRLFIVNCRFILQHPFVWIYSGLIAILMFPLRWFFIVHPSLPLLISFVLYVVLVLYLHWKWRSAWVLLMPLYVLVSSLVFTPIGIVTYVHMALKHDNWGIIRPQRQMVA